MHIETFHDPILSCAQSALHEVLVRRGHSDTDHLSTGHPAMQAVVAYGKRRVPRAASHDGGLLGAVGQVVGEVVEGVETVVKDVISGIGKVVKGVEGEVEKMEGTVELVGKCAELYVDYCIASWHGDAEKAQELYNEIAFSTCDPLYIEAITTFEEFKATAGHIPYVAITAPEGITELSSDTVTIALVGDWGTGTAMATSVLQQAATHGPTLVVHLGDTYYAGTTTENQANFLNVMAAVFPGTGGRPGVPVYNLPGNHDYYSGGVGFFDTLKTLGVQQASYFCLRTPQWQVVGLDTGYNDRDPFTVSTNITYLTDDQVAWLKYVMETAGGRQTVLLSHHQLYSGASAVGESKEEDGTQVQWGVNPKLYDQLKPYFGQVALWLWGHEHNTVFFNPVLSAGGQLEMPQGRCIGSGAVPMLMVQEPYKPATGMAAPPGVQVPQMNLGLQLGNNGEEYYHTYAILTLGPTGGKADYYQVPQEGAVAMMTTEPVPPPLTPAVPATAAAGATAAV